MKLCGRVELQLYAFQIQHYIKANDHVHSQVRFYSRRKDLDTY